MLLKNAGALLGSNERYFTVVYEALKYKGEDLLRTYIDFIVREPVEWIRNFPLKLRTRASFAKPKAAIIKLLKTGNVLETLGAEYCSNAHDVVWDTFKKHGEEILKARQATGGVADENELIPEGETIPTTAAATSTIDGIEEVTDISGAPPRIVSQWETKYFLLKSVVFMLLSDVQQQQPGLSAVVHTLINTLETADLA
jgi:hypothetical protein